MRRRQIHNPKALLELASFKQIDESAQLLLKHVRPIFVSDDRGRPDLEASGILVSAGAKKFVVTAAHVTDALDRSGLYVSGTASRQTLKLGGKVFSSIAEDGKRENDKIDVSVIELTEGEIPHFHPQSFLPLFTVDFLDDGKENAPYLVMGYPSKLFQKANSSTGKPASCPVMHVTQALLPSPLQRLGLSDDTHIFVRFKKTKVYLEGSKSTAPDPYGMSGGPVWRQDVNEVNGWKLVGMATDWNHQFAGFVILRFKEVLALIEYMHPGINIFDS